MYLADEFGQLTPQAQLLRTCLLYSCGTALDLQLPPRYLWYAPPEPILFSDSTTVRITHESYLLFVMTKCLVWMVFNGIKLLGPMPVWCQVSAVQSGKPYQCIFCPTQDACSIKQVCLYRWMVYRISLGQSGKDPPISISGSACKKYRKCSFDNNIHRPETGACNISAKPWYNCILFSGSEKYSSENFLS